MTRKARRFIFYIFLFLFIILAAFVILYAQGYSFDLQKKSLVITGALYLKSYPKEASIYIDNNPRGETNKFIRRLSPNKYDIRVSKSGYNDWQKTLEVESKLVTKAGNILLVKKEPLINGITNYNVKRFFPSNDNKKIIYLTDRATKEIDPEKQKIADPRGVFTYSQPALRMVSLARETDEQIYPAFPFKGTGFIFLLPDLKNLAEILWSNDGESLLLSFSDSRYYILNLKKPLEIINLNNLIQISSNYKIYNIKNLSFHPQNSKKMYFYSGNNLYLVELNNSSPYNSLISSPVLSNILAYKIHNDEILYVEQSNKGFYKANLRGSSFKKVFDIPFLKDEQDITIVNDKTFLVNSDFYLFDSQAQILKKIAENVEEVILSNKEEKLLWRTKNEIKVIWFEPESDQPLRKRYEIGIAMKTFEKLSQAAWYSKTNQHIIFVVGNEVKITELDDRDKRNTVNIFSSENPEIFYSDWNEKLYILSQNRLLEINISD